MDRISCARLARAAAPAGVLAVLLAGCAGGGTGAGNGSPVGMTPAVSGSAQQTAFVPSIIGKKAAPAYNVNLYDNWITMGGVDFTRTGYQAQNINTSVSNVNTMRLSWEYTVPSAQGGIVASPLVYHGYVIVVSRGVPGNTAEPGTVYALNTSNGKLLWSTPLGGEVRGTPTIADGNIIVGDRWWDSTATNVLPSYIYSINLATGAINWKTQIPGNSRSSPLVTGGVVYVGVSGGDEPQCLQGGLYALNEATGAKIWYYAIDPSAGDGGSVWSPISLINGNIVFGTGNTCNVTSPIGNAVVALNSAGVAQHVYLPHLTGDNSEKDDDQAGGILPTGGNLYFINKNGSFYGLNSSWQPTFIKPLGAADGDGMLSSPSTDGTTIVVGAGQLNVAASDWAQHGSRSAFPGITDAGGRRILTSSTQGKLVAFDTLGNQKWSITMADPFYGQAAINNGIVYAGIDNNLEAININTGAVLWTYAGTSYFAPSPAVVPSGLFAADAAGHVYRFHHTPW